MFEYLTEDIDLKDENFFFKTIKSLINVVNNENSKKPWNRPFHYSKIIAPKKK